MNILPIHYEKGDRNAFKGEGCLELCISAFYIEYGYVDILLDKYYKEDLDQLNVLHRQDFDCYGWNYYSIADMKNLLDELEAYIHNPTQPDDEHMEFYIEFLSCMRNMLAHADNYDCILFEGP